MPPIHFRQHPLQIVKLSSKYLWLLLIPLMRGLAALRFDLASWFQGAWLDLLTLFAIIFLGWLRWYCIQIRVDDRGIWWRIGLILRQESTIPFKNITAASAEEPFFFRPVKAVRLTLDTNCAITSNPDLQLLVHKRYSELMFNKLLIYKSEHRISHKITCKGKWWIVFSFIFSSTLSGILLLSTVLIQSTNIVGNYLELQLINMVNGAAEEITRILAIGLPPAAIVISLVLALGWAISFIGNLFRYVGFSTTRSGNAISISNGWLTKHTYYIDREKINYLDLRENLLMKIFRLVSVQANCSGYGKGNSEIPVFLPISRKKEVVSAIESLFPGLNSGKKTSIPNKSSWFRYCWLPLTFIVAQPIVAGIICYFVPTAFTLLRFACLVGEIPALWFLAVKLTSFYTSGIFSASMEALSTPSFYKCKTKGAAPPLTYLLGLNYSFAFKFHSLMIPHYRITKIVIKQSIFQVQMATCNLTVFTNNELKKSHRIVSLPIYNTIFTMHSTGLIGLPLTFFPKYKRILDSLTSKPIKNAKSSK